MLGASLNGPKLWIPDWFDVEVGVVREFGGLKAPWTARLNLGKTLNVDDVKPYEPKTIARKSAINWNKGTKVMVLDDPAGNTWIMKGFQLGLKPQRTYDEFMAAGPANFKKLPPGWKARVVTLQQDNLEKPEGGRCNDHLGRVLQHLRQDRSWDEQFQTISLLGALSHRASHGGEL